MKIGFDAKRLYNNFTGLGNYSRFVVEALSRTYPENEYLLFTPRVKVNTDTRFFQTAANIQTITPPDFVSKLKLGSFWRSFLIGRSAQKERVTIYHGLSHELPFNIAESIKKIVTIHDLIFFRYPQFYNPIDVAIYKAKVKHACTVADKIIAISQQTKEDIVNYLSVDESKIDVVYQGCHPNFNVRHSSDEISQIKLKYNLPQQYILNVGTIEERKNLIVLIKAMALMPKESRLPLVVIGKQTKYFDLVFTKAKSLGVLHDIHFLNGIPFIDFPGIYQGASLFVYPSLFEGFGIPLVEAIESNIPVITSVGSCFREAAGPDTVYISPDNEEELAFQITRILTSADIQQSMMRGSFEYIQQFNSTAIAKRLNALYLSVL